jgi:hypothetical protein
MDQPRARPRLSTAEIEIPLTRRMVAIVDTCDSDLGRYKWCGHPGGHTFYAERAILVNGRWKTIGMHRVILSRILGREPEHREECDHINGNGLDNRRSNLRLATKAENRRNKRRYSNNRSGFKGVCRHGRKWRADLQVNGKHHFLGLFTSSMAAAKAYDHAAIELHGSFARTNVLEVSFNG